MPETVLFDSLNYFLFLAAVFLGYYLFPARFRWFILLLASIVFYLLGSAGTFYVPLLIVLVTYICGRLVNKTTETRTRKLFFLAGVLINLGLLIFYKYINFLIGTLSDGYSLLANCFESWHVLNDPVLLKVATPLGISYITFQAIGYLIEINRGNQNAEDNLGFFSTYLLFHPKILSGPIERAHNFLPQLHAENKLDYKNVSNGIKRIIWGLFLKLVIANRLALFTDTVFGNYKGYSGTSLLIASVFFTFQLYADFAGYTEIAIGSAKILGFQLSENFNRPFMAKSITEFWRRWHISLTTWVTDYIYNPIVIKYRNWNKFAVVFAGIVTFVILGFWHGANWTFIIFGLLQGIALSAEFLSRKIRKKIRERLPLWLNSVLGACFTFGYFCLSLLFFRAADAKEAFSIIGKIFSEPGSIYLDLTNIAYSLMGLFILMFNDLKDELYPGKVTFFNNRRTWIRYGSYLTALFVIILFGVFEGNRFIYLQF